MNSALASFDRQMLEDMIEKLQLEKAQILDIRPEVLQFAVDMEGKLRANDHKGGWADRTGPELVMKIESDASELYELMRAIGRGEAMEGKTFMRISGVKKQVPSGTIRFMCADIANYAMMISNKLSAAGLGEEYE